MTERNTLSAEHDSDEISVLLTPEAIADDAYHQRFGRKGSANDSINSDCTEMILEDCITDSSSEENINRNEYQFQRHSTTRIPRRIADKTFSKNSGEVAEGGAGEVIGNKLDYQPGSNRHRSVSARVFKDQNLTTFPSETPLHFGSLEDSVLGLESLSDMNVESSRDGSDSGILTHSTSVESCSLTAFTSFEVQEIDRDKVKHQFIVHCS